MLARNVIKKTKQKVMLSQFGWKILDKNKEEDADQIHVIAVKRKLEVEARRKEMAFKKSEAENAAMAVEDEDAAMAQFDDQLYLDLEGKLCF